MTTLIKRSFSGGEISPSLNARVDLSKYQAGLKTCRNMYVMRHGGARNRPGAQFIVETFNSDVKSRLIEFVFNNDDNTVLVFGDGTLEFVRDGAPVLDGSGGHYRIATPYTPAQVQEMTYTQIGDLVYIAQQGHPPQVLTRFADNNWTLEPVAFGPKTDRLGTNGAPFTAPGGFVNIDAATRYDITAIDDDTNEESLPRTLVISEREPTEADPIVITIPSANRVDNASRYAIYRNEQLIEVVFQGSSTITFRDTGPELLEGIEGEHVVGFANNPFNTANNYPGVVTLYQQRLLYANTVNEPERIWASTTGSFCNFNNSFPTEDDDSFNFVLAGRRASAVRHLMDLNRLVILTQGSEWTAGASDTDPFTPTSINAQQTSYNGSSRLDPVFVNNTALYVQERGTIVRDFRYDVQVNGYRGNDLTIYSDHLFEQNQIVDWAYQQTPESIVWAVRDDGKLLGLTYVVEQNITAWHTHDFQGGFVESVTSIPEGNQENVYVVVRREINGATKRYVERLGDRTPKDIKLHDFMDAHTVIDSRNTDQNRTLTINGSNISAGDTFTLTSNQNFFNLVEIGIQVHLNHDDPETLIRLDVLSYNSESSALVRAQRDIPDSMVNTPLTNYSKAFHVFGGLQHLIGESVSVYGDGHVVASANNPNYTDMIVNNDGNLIVGTHYTVAIIGLPITADLETLNIDFANAETISDKRMLVNQVSVAVEDSSGIYAGITPPTGDDATEKLEELKLRQNEGYNESTRLTTGTETLNLCGGYSSNGRVLIRQVDPLPLTVLAISPAGRFPIRGNN